MKGTRNSTKKILTVPCHIYICVCVCVCVYMYIYTHTNIYIGD